MLQIVLCFFVITYLRDKFGTGIYLGTFGA